MKKLADISALDRLQGQANRSMGAVSELAVFNGELTNEIVKQLKKAMDGEYGTAYDDDNYLSESVGDFIGFKAFCKGLLDSVPEMPSEFSNPKFTRCTPKEQQRFLMRECEDAASAIKSFLGRDVDVHRAFAYALDSAIGHKYGPGQNYDAWKIHRYDQSDPAAEYGG